MLMRTRHVRWAFLRLMASCLGLIVLVAIASPAAAGQGGAAPAGIIGQVTDGTGAVLPGVTVTATSPALQMPSIAVVTDARGEYRLTPLPIGTYTVTYELAGFRNQRQEDIRLTVGFVARVDQVLTLGTVSETVTVSGASPLVDVTSTSTRTELTRESLDVLPTTRDGLKAFLGQVPGARTNLEVGMSGLSDGVTYRVYGQSGESWQLLEGLLMSAPSGGSRGAHLDFNAIDGTRVQTVGSNAEMPRRGMLVDAIVKSGGNDFHGGALFYGTGSALEADNVDDALRAQGIRGSPKLHDQIEFSGDLGGRIIRNKLWFFGAGSYKQYDREVLDAFYDDGTPVVLPTKQYYVAEKTSYQVTAANRLTGFFHRVEDTQTRDASKYVPAESRSVPDISTNMGKVEWQAVRGSSLVASVQYGFWDFLGHYDGLAPGRVATTDIATLYVTGDSTFEGRNNNEFRHHTKGVASWYQPDLLLGNHEFKAGFDHMHSRISDVRDSRRSGNYQLQFNNDAPFQIATYNYPVTPENNDIYFGLYAQDAWTLARRLTLSLGFRYAYDNAYAPEQCRVAGDFAPATCYPMIQMNVFNTFVPRLHAAFDLFGDGKTVLKGGWGRFIHMREMIPELTGTNRNNATTTTWTWRDLNGDRDYNPGEVNLDPNGADFRSISGSTDAVPNPNEKPPKTDEFSLTVERELMANWALRVSGIYARNFDTYRLAEIYRPYEAYNIPITNPDPGPDGVVGSIDDPGTFITYYDYPASLAGRAFSGTMLLNDPNADHTYKTIEVAATKRLAQAWQLMASYTATKINQPFAPGLAFNPNAEIFSENSTWEWVGKISGAYTFPHAILASANYEYRSGLPQARQVLFSGGRQIRTIVVNVEPVGSLRLPSTNMVDARVGKRFSLGSGRSMELRVDVFNALNINTTVTRVLRSGPEFLKTGVPFTGATSVVQAIVLPRIVQFGVSYDF